MSTEYSVKLDVCPHCGRCDKDKEIDLGVNTARGFCTYTSEYIANKHELIDWIKTFKEQDKIVDEYGEEITAEEMIKIIRGE